jgi:protein gp37
MNHLNLAHINSGEIFVHEKPLKINRRRHAGDQVPEKTIVDPYPHGFAPTFHRYRLDTPAKIKKQQVVFVGDMCDLFGSWIPDEWIKEVFDACQRAPQHTYLFLTKNPKRYMALANKGLLPENDNFWYGVTHTHAFGNIPLNHERWNLWVSVEPLMEDFNGWSWEYIDWLVIGAESGNRRDRVIPKREWIEWLVKRANRRGVPVFLKNNLRPIWGDNLIQQYPKGIAR